MQQKPTPTRVVGETRPDTDESEYIPYCSNRKALIAIYMWQTWAHARPKDGGYYGVAFFPKREQFMEPALRRENRRVTLKLARQPCIRCGESLSEQSTGDHIIPLSKGGPAGAQNYLPLCGKCNSIKGKKDLFEWWLISGRNVAELSPDVLCAYSRLIYIWNEERGLLDDTTPDYLAKGLRHLIEAMPYAHRLYMHRWLRQPVLMS